MFQYSTIDSKQLKQMLKIYEKKRDKLNVRNYSLPNYFKKLIHINQHIKWIEIELEKRKHIHLDSFM